MTDQEFPTLHVLPPLEREPSHLTRKSVVTRCLEPGLTRESVEAFVKNCAARDFLRPVGIDGGDGRAPYLYEVDSALIAKCLHTLALGTMDVAYSDGVDGIGRAVSLAMKAFAVEDHFPNGVPKGENLQTYFSAFGPSPAAWAILDHRRGVTGWSLHVAWTIDGTGRKRVGAKLWNIGNGFTPNLFGGSEPLVPHAETVLSLDRILPIILADREGMN